MWQISERKFRTCVNASQLVDPHISGPVFFFRDVALLRFWAVQCSAHVRVCFSCFRKFFKLLHLEDPGFPVACSSGKIDRRGFIFLLSSFFAVQIVKREMKLLVFIVLSPLHR